MNDRIKRAAYAVLKTDTFPPCVEERLLNREDLKDAAAIGAGVRRYLLKQPIEVRKNEYLADRFRFFGSEYPADYYRCAGHHSRNDFWEKCCYRSHPNDLYYWGWTHVSLDYGYILQNGLVGYMNRIANEKMKWAHDPERIKMLTGMQLSLSAIYERNRIISTVAAELAEQEPASEQRDMYLGIAHNMSKVPYYPAESFYEAIQAVWSVFLITPDSLGRIDQYLYPFYKNDIEKGVLTKEHALELIEELFIKVHESQVDNSEMPISGHNHLVVGGYLQNGEDGFNELSEMILDAVAELPTIRPQASFRYTKKTSPEVIRKITEYNKRCQLIVFVNDDPRIEGMVRAGIKYADAVEYTVVGCNEWCICGCSKLDLAHVNLMHALKTLLWDKFGAASNADSFDAFYQLFEQELAKDMRRIVSDYDAYYSAEANDINVITSALMGDCIENGRSFNNGGARYHGMTLSFNSISNVADSLSVIKEYVFEKKQFSFGELLEMLNSNWSGYEDVYNMIMKHAHFFGNDDPYVDSLAQRIVNSLEKIRTTLVSPHINTIVCGSFVGATHPNIIFGKMLPATPDGRYSGEELTMGVGQSVGRDRNGVSALLKSIACLDYSKLCGCVVSNLKMDSVIADTPEKLDKISQLFHAFLNMGGMQLQINYLSNEELKKAQEHPEEYENLMVRVTGYSGYFTLFDRDLQNDIIKRTEQKNA